MFEVTFKINGEMIAHIYGHNEGLAGDLDATIDTYSYFYRHYNVATGAVKEGRLAHKRNEGIEKLLLLIMGKICSKKKEK